MPEFEQLANDTPCAYPRHSAQLDCRDPCPGWWPHGHGMALCQAARCTCCSCALALPPLSWHSERNVLKGTERLLFISILKITCTKIGTECHVLLTSDSRRHAVRRLCSTFDCQSVSISVKTVNAYPAYWSKLSAYIPCHRRSTCTLFTLHASADSWQLWT